MYVSDYQLSLGSKTLGYINSDSTHYALMKTGWMHISNNDSLHYLNKEWTMTRFGNNNNYYFVWDIYSEGVIGWDGINGEIYIRPVFYLTENIKITSGKGSITEPFIIN